MSEGHFILVLSRDHFIVDLISTTHYLPFRSVRATLWLVHFNEDTFARTVLNNIEWYPNYLQIILYVLYK